MRFRKLIDARGALGVVTAVLAAAACNSPTDGVDCRTDVEWAVHATAVDAKTNANITSGAYLVITEGSYKDSVTAVGGLLRAGDRREGTYTVRVGHPGYFAFIRNNVFVDRDECTVVPVKIEAKLNPAPGDPN